MKGIQLAAKPETRAAAADELINEALSMFKKMATLVQRNLGASGYKILDVNIQSDQPNGPMYDMAAVQYERVRSSAMIAEPAIEAGTSRVSVQIYGRVQLD